MVTPCVRRSGGVRKGTQGGLVVRMSSCLGAAATKPCPQLLHSSHCSFAECYETLQLLSRPWMGAFRPPLLSSKIYGVKTQSVQKVDSPPTFLPA